MIENYMFDIVDNYIENEKNYIKQDLEEAQRRGYETKDLYEDLIMLENMTPNEKQEIADGVLQDGEIQDKINELIHYYLYHR